MNPIRLLGGLTVLMLLVSTGCGGGGHSTPVTGRVTLSIRWPDRSRLIPLAANSIRVEFARGAEALANKVIPRPSSGTETTTDFTGLKIGDLTLKATAFPNSDGTGVAQATGSAIVATRVDQIVTARVTMNSTIDHLDVGPNNVTVNPGQSAQMVATAKNAAGEIVLTAASKITWKSADTSIAQVDASGKVTGQSSGYTQIIATDTESTKSGFVSITVN